MAEAPLVRQNQRRNQEQKVKRINAGKAIPLRRLFSLREYPAVLADLRQRGHRIEILYLEAADEVLVRRFSETRRPHPLAFNQPAIDGIREEREALKPVRKMADHILDTTEVPASW